MRVYHVARVSCGLMWRIIYPFSLVPKPISLCLLGCSTDEVLASITVWATSAAYVLVINHLEKPSRSGRGGKRIDATHQFLLTQRVITVTNCALTFHRFSFCVAIIPQMTERLTAERGLEAFFVVSLSMIPDAAGEAIMRRLTPWSAW